MIEVGLYDYLTGEAEIIALVSDRVILGPLPPGKTLPAITFHVDGSQEFTTFDLGQADLVGAYVQIDAWGYDLETARELADVVKTKVKNHSGSMGAVEVRQSHRTYFADIWEDRVAAFRRSQSFTIWHVDS